MQIRIFSKRELVHWLDKHLRFTMLEKEDKVRFLEKAIDSIDGYTIQDLSINRYLLLQKLDNAITEILIEHAKKSFDQAVEDGKIKTKEFEEFPAIITLTEEIPDSIIRNSLILPTVIFLSPSFSCSA